MKSCHVLLKSHGEVISSYFCIFWDREVQTQTHIVLVWLFESFSLFTFPLKHGTVLIVQNSQLYQFPVRY